MIIMMMMMIIIIISGIATWGFNLFNPSKGEPESRGVQYIDSYFGFLNANDQHAEVYS